MPRLRELQNRMGAMALGEFDPGTLDGLARDDGTIPLSERLMIHRNNTLLGLTETLASNFPVVARLVGDAFFDRMARDFIRSCPPKRPDLFTYGQEFPAFIADYPKAASVAYLADMARLELAWNFAANAADRLPMPPQALSGFGPEQLESLRLVPHPSLRFVASRWPLLAIWRAHQSEDAPVPVDLEAGGNTLLVYRPHEDVLILDVGAGAFAFVMALTTGQSIAAAYSSALAGDPDFNIGVELARLLSAELYVEAIPS